MENDIYELSRIVAFGGTLVTLVKLLPVNVPTFVVLCMINFSFFNSLETERLDAIEQAASDSVEVVIEVE